MMKKRLLVASGLVLVIALALAAPALASEIIEGDPDVVIDEPIDDDVYVAGNEIVVQSAIGGDLIVMGNEITITEEATISGNLIAIGNTVIVDGDVDGDVGIAGYVARIGETANLADELFSGVYSLEMRPGSQVGDDFFAGAYQIVAQNVGGDLRAGAACLRIEGIVTGNATAGVGTGDVPAGVVYGPTPSITLPVVPGGLSFGDEGRIEGNLSYSSKQPSNFSESHVGGDITFERTAETPGQGPRRVEGRLETEQTIGMMVFHRIMNAIRNFITWVIVGVLLQRFAPRFFNGAVSALKERLWPSLGIGFAGLLFFPPVVILLIVVIIMIAVLLGAITLGGLSFGWLSISGVGLGAFVVTILLTIFWISKVVVGYALGEWLIGLGRPERPMPFWALALGVFLLAVAGAIPGINFLVNSLVVPMLGLGAVVIYLWSLRRHAEVAQPAV